MTQRFTQLTEDHSLIQQLLDKGEILRKDIDGHEKRHIVYATVGYEEVLKTPFIYREDLIEGSCYLLVSDGITDVLSDAEILGVLDRTPTLDDAIQTLIDLAQKHGEDNATALGIRIEGQTDD